MLLRAGLVVGPRFGMEDPPLGAAELTVGDCKAQTFRVLKQ